MNWVDLFTINVILGYLAFILFFLAKDVQENLIENKELGTGNCLLIWRIFTPFVSLETMQRPTFVTTIKRAGIAIAIGILLLDITFGHLL